MLANFAQELVELRACLSELRQENSDLCSQLLFGRSGEERERKLPRNLASSSLDLAPLSPGSCRCGCCSEHAIDDSRCFSQNRDSGQQCRSKSKFEPIESSAGVMMRQSLALKV